MDIMITFNKPMPEAKHCRKMMMGYFDSMYVEKEVVKGELRDRKPIFSLVITCMKDNEVFTRKFLKSDIETIKVTQ